MDKAVKVILMLGILQAWAVCAGAEIIIFRSAILWRLDERGDFSLPELSEGTYEIERSVPTDGLIETMTASWEFKGEVVLELSADGGRHYYKAINGVPLTGGFIRGDRLRWRAKLAEGSKLSEVRLTYTDSLGVTATFGEPELSGFRFRKLVRIKGSTAELYNYQVYIKVGETDLSSLREVPGGGKQGAIIDSRFRGNDRENGNDREGGLAGERVSGLAGSTRKPATGEPATGEPATGRLVPHVHCEGNLETDFVDIRFTAADGETLLSYYREDVFGESPDRVTFFWIRIPQIPVEGLDVYMYYGNARAEDLSSDKEVFEISDNATGSAWARKYAEVEPVVDTEKQGEQEEALLPLFVNTVLAPNGNVVLAQEHEYSEGVYITRAFKAPFRTRILVPSWKGRKIAVDISADGDRTYKENSESDLYYYASREDFAVGTRPGSKVRFIRGAEPPELEELELDYAPGIITVITPNGGETWHAGTTKDILWSALEYDFFYPMRIEYSLDKGRTYEEIARTDNNGIYSWTIPGALESRNVMIRVSDADDSSMNDTSDAEFLVER